MMLVVVLPQPHNLAIAVEELVAKTIQGLNRRIQRMILPQPS
jgi:hypothetical protein